jgi:hypothetical protein
MKVKAWSFKLKVENTKPKGSGGRMNLICSLLCIGILTIPMISVGQEVNREGWPVPDLRGLIPYSIQVQKVDGVEKIIERFYTPDGGHVARISGNGKTFAYVVDHDREPPIDYLLLDPDGLGKFTQKFRSEDSYKIPEWVSR